MCIPEFITEQLLINSYLGLCIPVGNCPKLPHIYTCMTFPNVNVCILVLNLIVCMHQGIVVLLCKKFITGKKTSYNA